MKYLTPLTAFLVLLIAFFGFVLSYDALHAYAIDNGVLVSIAWMWPLVIDGFMLVISLSILLASLRQEATRYLWTLAIMATVVSVSFNVAHAPATVQGRAVAVVAPVALFLAFEVFVGQIRNIVKRTGAQESLRGLNKQATDLTDKIKHLQAQTTKAQTDFDIQQAKAHETNKATKDETKQLRAELSSVKREIEAAQKQLTETQASIEKAKVNDTRTKVLDVYRLNPFAKQKDVAETVGISRQWVSKLLTEMQADGTVHVNGNGVEVKE